MKLLLLYSCLLAILLQALSASTSLDCTIAFLKSKATPLKSKKPVAGGLGKKEKPQGKVNLVVKEDKPKSLSELLPKTLVAIVIGYFKDDTYPILVSTHSSWRLFIDTPKITVDSARVYVMTCIDGIKGLSHSSANLKENKRRYIEFNGSGWFDYGRFASSDDGRYASFSHSYQVSTHLGSKTRRSTKWLMQSNESEDERFKKEAGKDSTAVIKLMLAGEPRAVSGKGNRVMVTAAGQLEVHDVGKDASKLVCQISGSGRICALNKDGSEAAFVNERSELRILDVNKIVEDKIEQSVIFTLKVSESSGSIYQLVYSDENKLHVLQHGGRVSLFDPLTKTLVPKEIPQRGYDGIGWAISPNADYIATIQRFSEEHGMLIYKTTVKRKLGSPEWKSLFGYDRHTRSPLPTACL